MEIFIIHLFFQIKGRNLPFNKKKLREIMRPGIRPLRPPFLTSIPKEKKLKRTFSEEDQTKSEYIYIYVFPSIKIYYIVTIKINYN